MTPDCTPYVHDHGVARIICLPTTTHASCCQLCMRVRERGDALFERNPWLDRKLGEAQGDRERCATTARKRIGMRGHRSPVQTVPQNSPAVAAPLFPIDVSPAVVATEFVPRVGGRSMRASFLCGCSRLLALACWRLRPLRGLDSDIDRSGRRSGRFGFPMDFAKLRTARQRKGELERSGRRACSDLLAPRSRFVSPATATPSSLRFPASSAEQHEPPKRPGAAARPIRCAWQPWVSGSGTGIG